MTLIMQKYTRLFTENEAEKNLSEVRRQAVETLAKIILDSKHKWSVFEHRLTEQALGISIELGEGQKADETETT